MPRIALPQNFVSVIDTTNGLITTIPGGVDPTGIAISPDETQLYVANQGSSTVSVIDTATNTVTRTIAAGAGCAG